jgi:hypothetical protein
MSLLEVITAVLLSKMNSRVSVKLAVPHEVEVLAVRVSVIDVI